jgi:hypothetical protein
MTSDSLVCVNFFKKCDKKTPQLNSFFVDESSALLRELPSFRAGRASGYALAAIENRCIGGAYF